MSFGGTDGMLPAEDSYQTMVRLCVKRLPVTSSSVSPLLSAEVSQHSHSDRLARQPSCSSLDATGKFRLQLSSGGRRQKHNVLVNGVPGALLAPWQPLADASDSIDHRLDDPTNWYIHRPTRTSSPSRPTPAETSRPGLLRVRHAGVKLDSVRLQLKLR